MSLLSQLSGREMDLPTATRNYDVKEEDERLERGLVMERFKEVDENQIRLLKAHTSIHDIMDEGMATLESSDDYRAVVAGVNAIAGARAEDIGLQLSACGCTIENNTDFYSYEDASKSIQSIELSIDVISENIVAGLAKSKDMVMKLWDLLMAGLKRLRKEAELFTKFISNLILKQEEDLFEKGYNKKGKIKSTLIIKEFGHNGKDVVDNVKEVIVNTTTLASVLPIAIGDISNLIKNYAASYDVKKADEAYNRLIKLMTTGVNSGAGVAGKDTYYCGSNNFIVKCSISNKTLKPYFGLKESKGFEVSTESEFDVIPLNDLEHINSDIKTMLKNIESTGKNIIKSVDDIVDIVEKQNKKKLAKHQAITLINISRSTHSLVDISQSIFTRSTSNLNSYMKLQAKEYL